MAIETKFTIRAINKTQAAFAQIKKSVDNIDRRFGRLGSTLTNKIAPAFAMVFAGGKIVHTITSFEKLEASLRTVTGSAEKAASAFKAIQDFAAQTLAEAMPTYWQGKFWFDFFWANIYRKI